MTLRILLTAILIIAGISGCGKDKATESQENHPPAVPSSPSPVNGATDQPLSITLSWQCSDPDGDTLSFDIYFGTQQDPPLISSNQHETSYQPGQLQYNSTYYWRVVAKDENNNMISGPIWSFSTPNLESGIHLIGHYNTPYNASEIFVSGDYAYIVTGLLILDISDPSQPTYAGFYSTSCSHVFVYGNYAFMTYYFHEQYEDGHLLVLDVSDPPNPQRADYVSFEDHPWDVVASSYSVCYVACSDSLRRFLTTNHQNVQYYGGNGNGGRCLFMSDYLYETEVNRLYIFSGLDYVGSYLGSIGTPSDLFVDRDFAFLACGSLGLQIINISNPSNPSFAGAYITSHEAMGVTVSNDFAFVAAAGGGLQVIDVADPANPFLVTSFETPAEALGVFYEDGYIYVAASSSGVYILQFVP